MSPIPATSPPLIRRKPTRETLARINGTYSRGPVTEDGKRASSRNALTHGLRARRHLAVPALGEDPDEALAHFAAVRAELDATGPVARHLAETAAAAMLRSARADRLEAELLASLAGGVAKALASDRDARAALALFQRYRREAEGELRRALDSLRRLHRARVDGLFPYGHEAEAIQAELDDQVPEQDEPNEPSTAETEPPQPVTPAANDDAAPPPAPSGAALLRQYRWFRAEPDRAGMWRRITPAQRAAVLAAAGAGHLDPGTPYDALRSALAGTP